MSQHASFQPYFDAAERGSLLVFIENPLHKDHLNVKNDRGKSLLYVAAKRGHLKVVQHLVERGADINFREDSVQSTPLHAASYYNHPIIVQYLIGMGAERDVKNTYDLTPLDESENEQTRELIRHPTRLATKRFEIPKTQIRPFVVEEKSRRTEEKIEQNMQGIPTFPDIWCFEHRCSRRELIEWFQSMEDMAWAADKLEAIVGAPDTIWNTEIIRLYTCESPLYSRMNIDLSTHNAISKHLPYACALRDALTSDVDGIDLAPGFVGQIYRSATMSDEDIECYRQRIGHKIVWECFSSTSRNMKLCDEWSGNVLFVFALAEVAQLPGRIGADILFAANAATTGVVNPMGAAIGALGWVVGGVGYAVADVVVGAFGGKKSVPPVSVAYGARDIASFSVFEDEEEVLLLPGCSFEVISVRQAHESGLVLSDSKTHVICLRMSRVQ